MPPPEVRSGAAGVGAGAPSGLAAPAALPEWFTSKKTRPNLIVSRWVPLALVGAPVLVLFAIVVYPTVWMFYHAFQNTNMMRLFRGNWSYVGWENFGTVLTSERFWDSVQHLVQYLVFGAVPPGAARHRPCADPLRGGQAGLAARALPHHPGAADDAAALDCRGAVEVPAYPVQRGDQRRACSISASSASTSSGSTRAMSLWSIIIADIWNWTALPLLIIYSGRVSRCPPAVYEAARVDGASGWLVLRRITLPMLKEVIAIAFIIRFMDAFKFVDLVYVMTSGGPAQTSELPTYIAFQRGIREFEVGEAAAYAIIIFAFSAILIILFLRYLKKVLKAQGIA